MTLTLIRIIMVVLWVGACGLNVSTLKLAHKKPTSWETVLISYLYVVLSQAVWLYILVINPI